MRNIFLSLIALALLSTVLSDAQAQAPDSSNITADTVISYEWYSFEEALALSEVTPKKIFIDIYTEWCGWCKRMDQNTFSNPIIEKYLFENYYPVKFNAETSDTISFQGHTFVNPKPGARRSAHELAISLLSGKMGYPSFVFLDEDHKMLTVVQSYVDPKQFEPMIRFFAEDAYLSKSWAEYTKDFKGSID